GGQLFSARQSGDSWAVIDYSFVADGFVSAQVTTLGTFAIMLQRNEALADIGPTCDATASEHSVRIVHVADLHALFGYEEQYFS
ncbi:hypothetical protein, partial [Pseudoalteromonas sp. S1731]|uniref:hypothetical protein n=1 Tax=Pseudoalteromonas sp. S1731 TaxID=579515 RepID=UPI00110D1717